MPGGTPSVSSLSDEQVRALFADAQRRKDEKEKAQNDAREAMLEKLRAAVRAEEDAEMKKRQDR